jgi:hypothetical protein
VVVGSISQPGFDSWMLVRSVVIENQVKLLPVHNSFIELL